MTELMVAWTRQRCGDGVQSTKKRKKREEGEGEGKKGSY
jgi:hypothetical protein